MSKKQKVGAAENVKQCQGVLKSIQRKKEAIFFLEPVDWKALNLPLYPKLIKKPMDLGTIEQKLQASPCVYKTVADFANDVHLVWSNAQTFNLEGSEIYGFASSCKEVFEAKMADVDHHGALREAAPKHGGDGELAACKKVVGELTKSRNAELFVAPVDWKGLGLFNYLDVIKKPMDLGTISANIESGKYKSVLGVKADVDLVWSNAMTYNLDGSYVYEAAAELKKVANQKIAPLIGEETPPEPEVTFEMLAQLNEDVALLTPMQIIGFLRVVQEACSRAVKDTSDGDLDLDLDALDLPAFLKVDEYVRQAAGRRKLRR
jgi:hypothetical protein